MAGLLETIARRLLGGSDTKKSTRTVKRTVTHTTPITPTATETTTTASQDTATEWVKNSTVTGSATAIDRTIKRERTNRELAREDYLLNQIDEFREKAQQLQDLLLSKETKVAELQNIVDEREGKARELEYILTERQKKADGITEEMNKQIESLIDKVSAKMDEIGTTISTSVNASVGEKLEEGQQLSEKQLAELQELKELLESLNPQLETVRAELSEKVHTENVKCYRNISDLFKSVEDKLDKMSEVHENVLGIRKCMVVAICLGILNLLGLVALALYELGVFQLLLG